MRCTISTGSAVPHDRSIDFFLNTAVHVVQSWLLELCSSQFATEKRLAIRLSESSIWVGSQVVKTVTTAEEACECNNPHNWPSSSISSPCLHRGLILKSMGTARTRGRGGKLSLDWSPTIIKIYNVAE